MTLSVGIVGVGLIGQDHARLSGVVAGAKVAAVADADPPPPIFMITEPGQ